MADLVTRHGGIPYPAPCLREVHDPDAAETLRAVDLICGHSIDAVIFLTGVGVLTIVEGARRVGRDSELVDELSRTRVAVRGPKTLNALRRLGLHPDLIAPEPYTSESLLESIREHWTSLANRSVLVQLYGAPVPAFRRGLKALGADVHEVSPYRWERPLDEEAVVRLIEDLIGGWIDVLAATNAAQVDYLFEIARDAGREGELYDALSRSRVRVAAQGVVCASAFARKGIEVHCVPPRASMGAMVMELARAPSPATPAPVVRNPEVVALYVGRGVAAADLRRVIDELPASATLALLAGSSRLAGRYAVERGHAVEVRDTLDSLIRPADRVVLVSAGSGMGAALQLVRRYAKPAGIISISSSSSNSRDVRS
jgi:uroporphyrinogen-III synthase